MSKIHDALRRAERERAETLPVSSRGNPREPEIAEGPAGDRVAPVMKEHESTSASTAGVGQFLRLNDLLCYCARPVWQPDPSAVVFSESQSSVLGAEQFRTLRSRLYQIRDTSPLKKVLVTSAISGEGKTFVATNLAQAIARERDRKVLLIDGDLRNPQLHLTLGAPLSPGLSDYLRGEASEADIVQYGQEGNLCFIAGGHEVNSASELLLNGRLPKLLGSLAPLFDWVIVDSPPCLPIADAAVLASFTDGVLLVVRATSTPAALAQKARKELQKRNIIGAVLNGIEDHPHGMYYNRNSGYAHVQS